MAFCATELAQSWFIVPVVTMVGSGLTVRVADELVVTQLPAIVVRTALYWNPFMLF